MRMCHFWAQNGQFVLNKLFLVQTIIITFIFLLALFILQNLKQILTLDPELWECAFFGPKMVHLPQTKFVWKIINIILIYLLAPFFNCAKVYKNSSRGSRVLRMHNFWAQNGPFPQIRIFFRKPVNKPCFFHSCLSTCQKSKWDINLLVKYWRLKNTKISLAESHFWLWGTVNK